MLHHKIPDVRSSEIGENELNPSLKKGRLISITDTRIDRQISPENIQKLAQLRRRALEFDDQALGTELVRSLIEIEKLDATTLKEVQDVLQVKLKYLTSKKELESRHQKKYSFS